jgi:hypothetical protein
MAYVFGDTSGDLTDHTQAGGQTIELFGPDDLVGDAAGLLDHSRGGDDILTRSFFTDGTVIGDVLTMADHAVGGNDTVVSDSGKAGAAYAVGDALNMSDHASGGDDDLSVSAPFQAGAWGDAQQMAGHAHGGGDVLSGGSQGSLTLYGDAGTMSDHTVGGNDSLSGSAATAYFYGDARTLSGHARGGDDRLSGAGGSSHSELYGDGLELLDQTKGGNDTLLSANGVDDIMYGDAKTVASGAQTGADTFVFSPGNAKDQIMDFESGKDHIQLQGYALSSFEDLASHFQDTDQGMLIAFDAANNILVAGVHQLSASDFLLS